MRRYVLGQLSEDEELSIELRLLGNVPYGEEMDSVTANLIDDYLANRLSAEERKRLEQRFQESEKWLAKLKFALALQKSTESRRYKRRGSYLAIAAMVLIALGLGFGIWRTYFQRSEVAEGLNALTAAYRERRPIESRVTSLDYAPFFMPRGQEQQTPSVVERQAERHLLDAVVEKPNAESHHALGQLYLARRLYSDAIAQFEAALKDKDDAQLRSDFGAALLESGKISRADGDHASSVELFARALEHFDRALQLKPDLPAPLFNRALCLEAMIVPDQARDAWLKYLETDSESGWADEARRHLQALQTRSVRSVTPDELLQEFIAAYRDEDFDRAWELLSGNREMISGRLVLRSLAIAFLNVYSKGDRKAASEMLAAMQFAGDLERQRAKDPYFAEVANFYANVDSNQRATLLEAQDLLSNGLRLCLQGKYADALDQFLVASAKMRDVGDHWDAKIADYWIAYSYYKTDRIEQSLEILSALTQSCQAAGYRWLQSQALSQTGNIETDTNNLSQAIESYNMALTISEELSDVYSVQKALSQLGSVYRLLADYRQSLAYLDRAVLLGNLHPNFPRQAWRNYSILAQTLYSAQTYVAAEVYATEALRLSIDELKDPATTYITQLNLALIARRTRGEAEAMDLARASFNVIDGLPNDSAKGGMIAKALLHMAQLKRYAGNCSEALNDYDKAIQIYDQLTTVYEKYEVYKGRLLCHLAIRNDSAVRSQLPVVLQLYETYRTKILEERNRNSFFDAEQDVYDIAIDFAVEQERDPQLAFELSEKSRSRSLLDAMKSGGRISTRRGVPELFLTSLSEPLSFPGLQPRLPENVQIIQYAVLDDRVLIWFISRNDFKAFDRKIAAADLKTLVFNFRNKVMKPGSKLEDSFREGSTLYATLLSPVASLLSADKVLCVVPDKFLNYLPFAALTAPDTGHPIVADYALVFAPSSNVFLMCSENGKSKSVRSNEHLLSIGNPSFNRKAYPLLSELPSAEREANNVAQLYKSVTTLTTHSALKSTIVSAMAESDVVHYAGHYVADHHSPMLSKLLLASKSADGADSLYMYEVFSRHLPRTRLLILSACGTAIERSYDGEGMVGVARAFIAAGVPMVVATQWAIDSEPSLSLMTSFHRYRKLRKTTTVEALRRAQSDMVYGPDAQYRAPYYWAGFILIGGHATY